MQQEILENKSTSLQKPALGFLGLGWIGRNRMEVILNEGCASAICISEPDEENLRQALQKADGARLTKDMDDMVKDPQVDAVVIATPSALHAEQSIQALQHGKAVFCQKPLGRTAPEVTEVVEASRKANRLLGVDLSYRHTRAMKAIYPLISNGHLGDIFAVDLVFHNAYGPDKPWFYDIKQSGGGCVMDLGVHLIDLASWCLNFPEIDSVQSTLFFQGRKLDSFDEQAEDFASASMQTREGAVINLQCSWNLPAGRDAIIQANFYGTRGGASFRNINGSFYDFIAEKYEKTRTQLLSAPPDDWMGRAGVHWVRQLVSNPGFDAQSAREFIKTAEIIDMIYGR